MAPAFVLNVTELGTGIPWAPAFVGTGIFGWGGLQGRPWTAQGEHSEPWVGEIHHYAEGF